MLGRVFIFALMLIAPWVAAAATQSPKVIRTVEPRYPDRLMQRAIYEGEARVVALIDAEGKLADWLLVSYSHPLFGREATEALRQWRFEPGRIAGEPVDVRLEMDFVFQARGMVLSVGVAETMERFQKKPDNATRRVSPPRDLDRPLAPLQTVRPLWPSNWQPGPGGGRVVLDFFVDEAGRARMPVVLETDDPALALPAMEALSRWRFEVPTRAGVPVIVRATQSFRFQAR